MSRCVVKDTFSSTLAKEHVIARLEATIYNYNIGNSHKAYYSPLEDCLTLFPRRTDILGFDCKNVGKDHGHYTEQLLSCI